MKTIRRTSIALVCLIVASYGLFEARKLLEGPVLTVTSPIPGSATSSSVVTIAGEAYNIAFLTINGKPAYTDESGHFIFTLSPPSGYTVFTVAASDRFGRHASKTIALTVLDFCPVHA